MNIESQPSHSRRNRLIFTTMLVVLIAVAAVGIVALVPTKVDPFHGPHGLLVEYHGSLIAKCDEDIQGYRDGRITYYCNTKEVASDTVPADKMAILLDLAARMETTTFSATDFAHGETIYTMSFFGDALSDANTKPSDNALRLQTCRDLVAFMRQKYG